MFDKLIDAQKKNSGVQREPSERELLAEIDLSRLPKHIAIIMDGNGRWAEKRGMPRAVGHRAGVESLRGIIKLCRELEIGVLTVYAFSTENWKRPHEEITVLMDLLVEYFNKEVNSLHREGVRINPIGRLEDLPRQAAEALKSAIKMTKQNNRLIFNIAINYGGRMEIIEAVRAVASEVAEGLYQVEQVDAELFSKHLFTTGLPEPDLLIRPSGDFRISNFLLWQLAYTEFWFTDVLWPEFKRVHMLRAIVDYQRRIRRFGGLT